KRPDLAVAFYILRTLCSAVTTLQQCRVSDFVTTHGLLSVDSTWIDEGGDVYSHNHFFGLAKAYEVAGSVAQVDDVRDLGGIFWHFVSKESWVSPERAESFGPNEVVVEILSATGLTPGKQCASPSELLTLIDGILASG